MRNILKLVPVVALLVVSGAAGHAQQMPGAEEINKRFEQMDRRMQDALNSQGAERRQHMHEHMRIMNEQMQAMHGMMGAGMMRGGGPGMGMGRGGMMGRGPHGPGAQMGPSGNRWMQHMQNRVDMMQSMMEQMHKQHELMLNNGGK